MARIENNDLTLGLRGKFGTQFLFRRYRNRTIAMRQYEFVRTSTAAQLACREKFRIATRYAKRCMLIPELKSEYSMIGQLREITAFVAAVTDYLKPIVIQDVQSATYNGEAGFPITIMVNDVHKVKTISVTITDQNNNVVESGEASIMQDSPGYSYVTQEDIGDVFGYTIKVEATDRPGNSVTHQLTLW
ncbi:MAG TPA: hypothetical protein VKZ68_03770 [Ohtaekwangia sp.]|nr:hypothetical protein [Ohtaekwangia sp.]